MSTKISIIVTSYTTKQISDIEELLDSIKTQSYSNIETIFVVERSQELYSIVKTKEKEVRNLKVLFNEAIPGISACRNLGIQESKGQIVAFVDDDAVLTHRWAEETARVYDNYSEIIGLTGPIVPLWEEPSMAWFPREFYWIFACTYYDWTEPREVRNGYGTNISFRIESFNSGGQFAGYLGSERGGAKGQQKTTAEETELSLRIRRKTGKRIEYNPKIIVNHKVHSFRLTRKYLWKRGYIEGSSKMIIRKVYKDSLKKDKVLQTEYDLLKRILFKLLPDITKGVFTKPVVSWRRFYVTVIVLSAVASGYIAYLFKKTPV